MNIDLALTGVKGRHPAMEVMNDQGSQGDMYGYTLVYLMIRSSKTN
jgi:hypothetical protein